MDNKQFIDKLKDGIPERGYHSPREYETMSIETAFRYWDLSDLDNLGYVFEPDDIRGFQALLVLKCGVDIDYVFSDLFTEGIYNHDKESKTAKIEEVKRHLSNSSLTKEELEKEVQRRINGEKKEKTMEAKIINTSKPGLRLSQGTLVEILQDFNKPDGWFDVQDFENGVKITFTDHNRFFNDHTLEMTDDYSYESVLYLFNDGTIYYVDKGKKGESVVDEWAPVEEQKYERYDFEDVSSILDPLNAKLGIEYRMEKTFPTASIDPIGDIINDAIIAANKNKAETLSKRRESLIGNIRRAISEGNYSETVYRFDTKTKQLVEEKSLEEQETATQEKQSEWCRKAKYNVQIELGCYKIDEQHPLLEGFIEKEFERDGVMVKYAVKTGTNELEQNTWTTNPDRPFIITGTVGERWPVKPSNLTSYDVNIEDIGVNPITVSTKDPSDQEFLVATRIPLDEHIKVISKWAYRDDGTIDETQVLTSNSEDAKISHAEGDYIVAKHIDGRPEYMELSEEERNTKEAATIYSPRIINGSVMKTTYDHALTQEEILAKYEQSKSL